MQVTLTPKAQSDLWKIKRANVSMAARIWARIEKLKSDPSGEFIMYHDEESIYPFQALKKMGFDISILKSRAFSGYRVFYFLTDSQVVICGIVPRDENTYDAGSEHVQEIIRVYREPFGITTN